LEGRRYIVCRNEDQAKKDAADREAILAHLREALRGGDLQLVGNRGYRKYLRQDSGFTIDGDKVARDARYDGLWVLRSNTALTPRESALKYKQLWMVEDLFRTTKSVLETRPVWHKRDETIRGHVFCTFLALMLKTELFERLAKKDKRLEWADIRRDLDAFQEIALTMDGTDYRLRTPLRGTCHEVFAAAGVAPPPTVR
jgi:transposase